ncbi:hypothetical protein AUC43_12175 [Hymenobacter sedentarius]|uniref:Polyhydroxyalkanoate synthesis regulator phasin n=1 Tax=Hymenobacter sedentarius TaxID=1411621 RepID=A0A0U3SI59_9BACT|nr:hypothetical protein [Hymenobacter sedentarius]ALW85780.1 hypothetical protein AUC43_12175 [Hymenobacter sedentarius]
MEDLFKKFVNAGVGYIAQGSKSVQTTIEKLVKDNKMTQAEGKKIVDELMKSGESKRAELEKQFQGLSERIKSTVGLGETKPKSKPAAKKPAAKSAAKPASSATSKAAGATKKAADKVSSAAGTAQKSAAAKAGTAKKTAAKKPAASASAATGGDNA